MEQLTIIPKEILCVIPKYDGDEKLLNFFLSKCDYVINMFKREGNAAQDLYIYHSLTSRLTGRAAILLSEHLHVKSWEKLKTILIQNFEDSRSEDCIALQLENLKIYQNESYVQLFHRIQNLRTALFAKVYTISDEAVKTAKIMMYNNTALKVFMYNLPEELFRIVRIKQCTTLEHALTVVTEEVNFQEQYNMKNNKPNYCKPLITHFNQPHNKIPIYNDLKFGSPQTQGLFGSGGNQSTNTHQVTSQNKGLQSKNPNSQQHVAQLLFGQGSNTVNLNRTPFQHSAPKFGSSQQQPSNSNQFKFGIENQQNLPKHTVDTDDSMSTEPVRQTLPEPLLNE